MIYVLCLVDLLVVHHGFQFDNYPISPTLLQRLGNKNKTVFSFIYLCFFYHSLSLTLSMENMFIFIFFLFLFLRRSQKYVLCFADFLYIFCSLLSFTVSFIYLYIFVLFCFVSVCFGISFHILFDFHEKRRTIQTGSN